MDPLKMIGTASAAGAGLGGPGGLMLGFALGVIGSAVIIIATNMSEGEIHNNANGFSAKYKK